MKRTIAALLAIAAIMTGELSTAEILTAESIGLTRTEFSVGDQIELKLGDNLEFNLKIVSAPPAGIAGQSFIANDLSSNATAILKPSGEGAARISIDDFENGRMIFIRVKNGEAKISVKDTSATPEDRCGTCEMEAAPEEANSVKTTSRMLQASGAKLQAAAEEDSNAFETAEQKNVVDILVAYDLGAKKWVEDGNCEYADTLYEFADYAISKMNTVSLPSHRYGVKSLTQRRRDAERVPQSFLKS